MATDVQEGEDVPKKAMDLAANAFAGVKSRKARGAPVEDEPLPPQTIMARLLRELEDDCIHYKS